MGKGVSALSYLPQVHIEFVGSAGDQSINALKAAFNKIARMQEEEVANGTYPMWYVELVTPSHQLLGI